MPDTWSPNQYEKFKEERSQPFRDLVKLVEPRAAMRVVDLGCGTGELTRTLHRELGAAQTVGIDSSSAMLQKAQDQRAPGLSFTQGRIEDAPLGQPDLILSNAALHWVEDHPGALRRFFEALRPGGQIAIQMPTNFDHPSHLTADELAAEPPFRDELAGYQRDNPVLLPERYAQCLYDLGFARQAVKLQVYAHVLEGPEQVVEWVQGTLLTPIKSRLSPADYDAFVSAYRARLLPRLGSQRPFLYTFKRLFLWATR